MLFKLWTISECNSLFSGKNLYAYELHYYKVSCHYEHSESTNLIQILNNADTGFVVFQFGIWVYTVEKEFF